MSLPVAIPAALNGQRAEGSSPSSARELNPRVVSRVGAGHSQSGQPHNFMTDSHASKIGALIFF